MGKKPHTIDELDHDNRGSYTVPEGYFWELSTKLKEIPQQAAPKSWWLGKRKIVALTATSMAVLAIGTFVSITISNHIADAAQSEAETFAMVDLYDISVDDIVATQEVVDDTNTQLFADATIDHLEYYGDNITEILE